MIPVHLVSLGCARNDVDSEELAARLAAEGFTLVGEPEDAVVIVVNTCGFIEPAKKDSIDTLLAAADLKQAGQARTVVAVGCLAERYGRELAGELPEVDAVFGFDAYPQIGERLRAVLAGERPVAHRPTDRRRRPGQPRQERCPVTAGFPICRRAWHRPPVPGCCVGAWTPAPSHR